MIYHNIKISVVIPVYNAEKFIKEAIDSILNQSHTNIEIICIDDSSTDSSLKILKEIKDSRLIIYENDSNFGVIFTRSKAYSLCSGDFVANMDADDISHKDRFKIQLNYLINNPTVDVVGSYIKIIDEQGRNVSSWSPPLANDDICASLLFEMAIANPTIMLRHSRLKEHLHHDKKFLSVEDYELWCRLAILNFTFANIPSFLLLYRVVSEGMTMSHEGKKDFRNKIHELVYNKNFQNLGIKDIDVKVQRSLVAGNISSIEQLEQIYLHLLKVKAAVPISYCSKKALNKKISMLWAYCCLRASTYFVISPIFVLEKCKIVTIDKYSLKNLTKAIIRGHFR